jgi:predicted metal-dependent enzyme (double-stranded beta helix superfamily)
VGVTLDGYTRDLTQRELRGALARLSLRPDVWGPLVGHDLAEPVYRQLFRDDHLSAWLVCWMPGHDTGFHDHAGSAGAVAVLGGAILEQRIGSRLDVSAKIHSRGQLFDFGPDVIHRVRHRGSRSATTLHAYSPPLKGMGAYVHPDGGLARAPLPDARELQARELRLV